MLKGLVPRDLVLRCYPHSWYYSILFYTGYRTKIMCGGALMFALVGAAAQMRVRIDFYGECV